MSNVVKLKKRALDFEQKKQFDKALDTYLQVLDAMGDHVEEADVALFNRVGDLLLRQGNVGSAVDHYERAVDLYTDGGFHNNAIALCNKILRNAPGRNSVYYKLGRISAKKGFTNDAKQNFLEYADRMQRIGQFEEAFRALKEFAELCPDQDDIRLMLADQLVRGDRKAEAIDQLQFLFEKFEAEGRAQEARATMERMKSIDPAHEPKSGVARPTPKMNDLIFLDVNYDIPGNGSDRPARNGTRTPTSAPLPADVAPPAPPTRNGSGARAVDATASGMAHPREPGGGDARDGAFTNVEAEPTMPALGLDALGIVEASPVAGLSPGAAFAANGTAADAGQNAYGIVSHTDTGFITGFEETSLGSMGADVHSIEPMMDIEHSTPMIVDDDGSVPDASSESDAGSSLLGGDSAPVDDGDRISGGDAFPMIDISLDLIDDSPAAENGLAFIFPDQDTAPAWRPDHGTDVPGEIGAESGVGSDSAGAGAEDPRWSGPAEEDLRLEPLLQLPEIDLEPGLDGEGAPDIPLIAQGADDVEALDDDTPSTGPELHFLSLGNDDDGAASPVPPEITGFEHLDISGPRAAPVREPATPVRPVDALRASIELDPHDWELRRRLAEALLEEGDRNGGLAAFEVAMLGFERSGDIRSANAVVEEMIRVVPSEVRFHQKRVEYAVRSNDRSLLAEAYFSLAESLFQMGDLEKSRAVYARVLELSPGDSRARAALEAMGHLGPVESTPEPASTSQRPTNGVVPEVAEPEARPVTRHRASEPEGGVAAAGEFVNLSEWLREDEPIRNTRMVVDVKEPEIDDQVDFAEMLSMFKQGVAANVDASDHEAHYDLGVAYKEMGLLDEAISEFQKALRGTELRARTYEALGQCFVEKGQHQIAVTILSRALGDKSYTDDMLVGVLYLLGYASETLGRWADAQRFYERVFAVDIEFRDIGDRLATAERGGR